MHPELKETLIRARLSELGFDLDREPGGLDWIIKDRRERNEFMRAVPATRCKELLTGSGLDQDQISALLKGACSALGAHAKWNVFTLLRYTFEVAADSLLRVTPIEAATPI